MDNVNLRLEDIFLKEINSKKIDKGNFGQEQKSNYSSEPIKLSGQIMYSKNDKKLIKYIFGFDLMLKNHFEISLVYETYFILVEKDIFDIRLKNLDENKLGNILNRQIWPYVVEQVNSISSKMDLEKGITLPPYGVINNEHLY